MKIDLVQAEGGLRAALDRRSRENRLVAWGVLGWKPTPGTDMMTPPNGSSRRPPDFRSVELPPITRSRGELGLAPSGEEVGDLLREISIRGGVLYIDRAGVTLRMSSGTYKSTNSDPVRAIAECVAEWAEGIFPPRASSPPRATRNTGFRRRVR